MSMTATLWIPSLDLVGKCHQVTNVGSTRVEILCNVVAGAQSPCHGLHLCSLIQRWSTDACKIVVGSEVCWSVSR